MDEVGDLPGVGVEPIAAAVPVAGLDVQAAEAEDGAQGGLELQRAVGVHQEVDVGKP